MADESRSSFFKRFSSIFTGPVWADETKAEEGDTKKDCKACQICSEQRKAKDKCIKDMGSEEKCKDLIKAYDECVKKNGGLTPKNGKKA